MSVKDARKMLVKLTPEGLRATTQLSADERQLASFGLEFISSLYCLFKK
jgi:hypothetical protein